ncbi:solute carrier family 22 member 6 [Lepisosteus oculatus]
MAFADVLEQVGGTGRFQALHVVLLSAPMLLAASHNLLQNFAAAVPVHRCRAPANLSRLALDARGRPAPCHRFAPPRWNRSHNGSDPGLEACRDGWEYDLSEMSSTVITEWDLVCDLRSLKQMGQTIYMGGVLVGAGVFGSLSDRFGRKWLMLSAHLLLAVSGTCAAFSPTFPAFCVFRFVCGMALSGIMLNSFSLTLEWIPTRVRTLIGMGTGYCYTIGQLILAGVAYVIRDWRWLTLAVSVPFYVSFLYSCWLLESARWLVVNGQTDVAVRNLQQVARINGRKEECNKINSEMLQAAMQKEISSTKSSHTALDLLRTPGMRRMTAFLSCAWFSTSFAYYGLSMDLQKFGVGIYLIQVIFGAVDIPAKLLIMATMSTLGRRPSLSGALTFAGTAVLANLLVPHDLQTLRTCLAVLGKGCLAASFQCCYLYSAELYPTVIRQNGMGWVSMMARLGAMVAPLVQLLGEFRFFLPGLIYGGAPVVSGIIAAFLPETLAVALPDTIQDVEERAQGQKAAKAPPKKEELVLKEVKHSLLKEAI